VLKPIFHKVFGTQNERELRGIVPIVRRINELEAKTSKLSDVELTACTAAFKQRLANGESLDELLPEAFAVVREAGKRVLNMRHFDVQLIGGTVLHNGKIAEMKTGEGKTLVATLPVYLNALTGNGVHLVTVNDYLARRDAEWMGQIYRFLGLEVGVIVSGMDHLERQKAYAADVTYGQNNEFGFDYLRDNMKRELAEKVQRGHVYAIVDEVDSILVDEARTPLIISGPADSPTEVYHVADKIVRKLEQEVDFTIELKSKQVLLTDDGVKKVEQLLGIDNLYDPQYLNMVHHVNQALKAHSAMKLDVDYVVRDDQVMIVDEFTGRLMTGRRWSDGLHQAVEVKEGVTIQQENQTLATITFQNYFRMYKKLSGMTGTADTEAVEFKKIYNLSVVAIPTNLGMARKDYSDLVFAGEQAKFKAVCGEIEELQERGQPVLVGTASIEKSELLSRYLKQKGIQHHVLNAKQHQREAEIVAQAGRSGAVTISTNMAGRGTDILLGGNPEFLAAAAAGTKDAEDPNFQAEFEKFKVSCAEDKRRVLEAGGLHILGTERHESRRIDNQLRGRSGRQGDPGSSRFYVSLEDDLMKRFGGERMQAIMARFGFTGDECIENPIVSRTIEGAQKKVEGYHFDIRKHLLEYDDVLNKQREIVYRLRDRILNNEEVEADILNEIIPEVVEDIIMLRARESEPTTEWDIQAMCHDFQRQFGVEVSSEQISKSPPAAAKDFAQHLYESFKAIALDRYQKRKERFGDEQLLHLERFFFLQIIDHLWKEHLTNIDHLREGIGLRGYAQKNPLHEYQREAYELFRAMMSAIHGSLIQNIFNVELPSDEELRALEEREREMQRRREERAKAVHQELAAPTAPEQPEGAGELSRTQTKKMEARERAQQRQSQSVESQAVGISDKRKHAKKKRKSEKQARRKHR